MNLIGTVGIACGAVDEGSEERQETIGPCKAGLIRIAVANSARSSHSRTDEKKPSFRIDARISLPGERPCGRPRGPNEESTGGTVRCRPAFHEKQITPRDVIPRMT